MKPHVVLLVGPTASGKTDLAISLAKVFPFEILNADSLQIFRHLNIGTAKPSVQQQHEVPHHLIDVLDPDSEGSAAWYAQHARKAISDIHSRKKIPLVVGGAGFYLRALEHPPIAPATNSRENPTPQDYEWLRAQDPRAAEKIHVNDTYRISRAVSLLRQTGTKPSEYFDLQNDTDPYTLTWLGLDVERGILYDLINRRVTEMFKQGLLMETENILKTFPGARRKLERAIGYRDALLHLEGKRSSTDMIEKAQQATRNYAKRQMTWFRKETRMQWLALSTALTQARAKLEARLA